MCAQRGMLPVIPPISPVVERNVEGTHCGKVLSEAFAKKTGISGLARGFFVYYGSS